MRETSGERQAENDQPYRQTVRRLILPGVHPPATLSIRPRGMRSIPSRVINNIWRLVFLRERGGRCYGGAAETRGGGKSLELRGNGRSLHFCITRTNERTNRPGAERRGHRWKYPIYMQIPYLSPREASAVAPRSAHPCTKEAMADSVKVQVFRAEYPCG